MQYAYIVKSKNKLFRLRRSLVKRKCLNTSLEEGIHLARLYLIYNDVTVKEYEKGMSSYIKYVGGLGPGNDRSVRYIENSYGLRKSRLFKGMGLCKKHDFVLVWSNRVIFVSKDSDLTDKDWEFVFRDVGNYANPYDIPFDDIFPTHGTRKLYWEPRLIKHLNVAVDVLKKDYNY